MLLSLEIRTGNLQPEEKDIDRASLIEHIKSVFRIDSLPVRGFHTVSAIVLLSVLLSNNGTITVKPIHLIQNP